MHGPTMIMDIRLTGLLAVKGADGRQRYLSSIQTRLALARLVLDRNRGTTRDELADTLWSGRLPPTWAPALRSVVSRIRRLLAESLGLNVNPLIWQNGRYLLLLPDNIEVDVEIAVNNIHAAQAALRTGELVSALKLAIEGADCLERGFLPECESSWVDIVRKDLDDLTVAGLETASMAAIRGGDPAGGLVLANRAVARAPLRESAHRCRIAAHQAAGNRAEALRAYEQIRSLMDEELGVGPDPETQAAYLSLLHDGPARS